MGSYCRGVRSIKPSCWGEIKKSLKYKGSNSHSAPPVFGARASVRKSLGLDGIRESYRQLKVLEFLRHGFDDAGIGIGRHDVLELLEPTQEDVLHPIHG